MQICMSWGRTVLLGLVLGFGGWESKALADTPESNETEKEEPRTQITVAVKSDKPMNLWLRPAIGKKREWQQLCPLPCSMIVDTEDHLEARDPQVPTVEIELPNEGGRLYVDINAGNERHRNIGLGVLIGGGPLTGGGLVLLGYGFAINLFDTPKVGGSLRLGDQLMIAGGVIGTVGLTSLLTGAVLTVVYNSHTHTRHHPPVDR